MFWVMERDDLWGAVSSTGKVVAPFAFELLDDLSDGLALFQRSFDRPFGYLNASGQVAIEERFERASPFSEGLAAASDPEGISFGLIDKSGAWVLEPTFEETLDLNGGLLPAMAGGRWGLADCEGRWALEPAFDEARFLYDVWVVKRGKKWGVVDREGSERVPFKYLDLGPPTEGRVAFLKAKKWGFLDTLTSEVVAPHRFEQVSNYQGGIVGAKLGGKWGALDLQGETVIPFEHERLGAASEGLVAFTKGKASGFMDLEGKVVLEGAWKRVHGFAGGVALVDDEAFIDRTGAVVATIDWDSAPSAEPPEELRLGFDERAFGPHLRAAIGAIEANGGLEASKAVLDRIDLDFPDALKALLIALAKTTHFYLDWLEMTPKMLRFQPSKGRVRIAEGDFGSEYWVEWSSRRYERVVEVTGMDEDGKHERRGRGNLDTFFRSLWETGLDWNEPQDPETSANHRAFARALAEAQR